MYRPIRFIPDDTKIGFIKLSRFGFMVSGALSVASILLFFFVGLNFGVDFKGGTNIIVRPAAGTEINTLRDTVDTIGFNGAELQNFGTNGDVLIRLPILEGSDHGQQETVDKLKAGLGTGVEILSVDSVGPKVSGELTDQGILAVVVAILCILGYVWMRFEWQFAVGGVISLLHDVLLTVGLFCALGIEFNLSTIAAILTIIGYSLNDTVVVFDRIREFLRKYKAMGLADLIDFSMNSVLPRTILTSVTTMLALIALYSFGGEVLANFTFTMIWGVIIGTYSSIFVAAPVLILLGSKRDWDAAKPANARP